MRSQYPIITLLFSITTLIGCGQKTIDKMTPPSLEGYSEEMLASDVKVFPGAEVVPDNTVLAIDQQKYLVDTLKKRGQGVSGGINNAAHAKWLRAQWLY